MKYFQMSMCKLQNDSKNIIILDTESYIKRLEEKNEILKRKNEILRANDQGYRRENETLKNENKTLQNENETLKNEIKTLKNENETLNNKNETLDDEIETLLNENKILTNEYERLQNEIETLQNEIETLKNEKQVNNYKSHNLTDTDITKLKEQLDDKEKTFLEIGLRLANIIKLKRLLNNTESLSDTIKLKRLLNNNESLSDTDITKINHHLNNNESHNLANTDIMKLQELLNKNESHNLSDTDITKFNQLLFEEYNKEELKYKESLDEFYKLKEQLKYNDDNDDDESHTQAEIEKIKEQLKHKPFIEIAKRLINENKAFRVQGYYTANENKMLFNDIKEQCSYMLYENARLLEEIKLCHTTEVKNLNQLINERDELILKLQKEIHNDYVVV